MNRAVILTVIAACWLSAGCEHLDIASQGNPDHVLTGSVRPPATLPAGAEIVVQVVDPSPPPIAAVPADLPVAARAPVPVAPRLAGENRQTLTAPTIDPVPFRVEYQATDEELRRGLNIDVRISVDGRVRFRTISAYILTLASSPFPQEVPVQAIE